VAVGRDLDPRRARERQSHHGQRARLLPRGDPAAARGRHGLADHRTRGGGMDAARPGVCRSTGRRPAAGAVSEGDDMMADELVHLAVAGGVGTITLDSPANRNALSRRLVADLDRHLTTALADPAVRVIVLTGSG